MIALALALQVAAASAGAPPAAATPPVVVTAPPPPRDVPALLRRFGRRPDGVDVLGRWQVALCPAVIGPPPDQTAYLLDRLHATAKTVGVPVADGHCSPNLIVVLTPDPDKVTAAIAKRGSQMLGPPFALDQYSGERSRFLQHDARPYHEFVTTADVLASHGSSDAAALRVNDLSNSSASTEGASPAFNSVSGPSVIGHANDTHLAPDIDHSFSRMVLVIDQNRLKGLSLQQVSAYVLMLSFAQVDDRADKAVKTILQVTDPDVAAADKPQDLTFWDRAYLGALYHAASQSSLGQQESEMDDEIVRAARSQTLLPSHVGLAGAAASPP